MEGGTDSPARDKAHRDLPQKTHRSVVNMMMSTMNKSQPTTKPIQKTTNRPALLNLIDSKNFEIPDFAAQSIRRRLDISELYGDGQSKNDLLSPSINILTLPNEKQYNMRSRHFKQISDLDNGSFGHVKKMLHLKSNLLVAVKIMKVTLDPEEIKGIKRDISTLEKARNMSPFLIDYYGMMARPNGEYWIVMELADCNLKTIIEKRLIMTKSKSVKQSNNILYYPIIPEYVVTGVLFCIANAMIFLKSKLNILHRDIKPSNIVYFKNGIFKLCDFGISTTLINSLAKSMNVGTVSYNAPEKIESPNSNNSLTEGYSDKSDVWSLGLVAYEMLKGHTPWHDLESNTFSVMCYILDYYDGIKDLGSIFISTDMQQIIELMTKRCISDRISLLEIPKHSLLAHYKHSNSEINTIIDFVNKLL